MLTWETALDSRKHLIQDSVKFSNAFGVFAQLTYNKHTRKVTVDVKKQTSIWFTGDIAAALGFDQYSYNTKKNNVPLYGRY
jgi:hypothetical protein